MLTYHIDTQISFQQILDIAKALPIEEKLALNDAIWAGDATIPLSHQLLVNDRIEKGENDPNRLLDWDEVSKTL
jgi:hypothetical protein